MKWNGTGEFALENVTRKMKTTTETQAVNQHVPRHRVSINSLEPKETETR